MSEKEKASKKISIDYDEILNLGGFSKLLDSMPFAISVQRVEKQIVVYENKKMIELVGSYLNKPCYSRWLYIPGLGEGPCPDCVLPDVKADKQAHRVFRKTITKNGDPLFLEIELIPLISDDANGKITHYMEVIKPVDLTSKAIIMSKSSIDEVINSLEFSMVKFGKFGGDLIYTNQLYFLGKEDVSTFLVKLSAFTFAGVFQGQNKRKGLYGPLPVLDKVNYLTNVYIFKVLDENRSDKRFKGEEHCILFIFYPREYHFLFSERDKIENFLKKEFSEISKIEQITEKFFHELTVDVKEKVKEVNFTI